MGEKKLKAWKRIYFTRNGELNDASRCVEMYVHIAFVTRIAKKIIAITFEQLPTEKEE